MIKPTSRTTKRRQRREYDVVLSFAGEDRAHIKKIAQLLKKRHITFFYDELKEFDLWGKDLYEFLDDVYTNKGRFCLMFLSAHYVQKLWTNHERKSAQARAFTDRREYILPVRIDDTKIPGIRSTQGFLDLRKHSYEYIADGVQHKLGRLPASETAKRRPAKAPAIRSKQVGTPDIVLHRIKKTFTQEEKERFLEAALTTIRRYFQRAITAYKAQEPDVTGATNAIDAHSFRCTLSVRGVQRIQCKIWLETANSSQSIYYSEGRAYDYGWNESLVVADDGYELFLRPAGMRPIHGPAASSRFSAKDAAAHLWRAFIEPLAH